MKKLGRVHCFYPQAVAKPENPTCFSQKKQQKISAHKLTRVANLTAGKHILDAIAVTEGTNSKSGEIVRKVLENARRVGVAQGLSEDRLFVKTAITGKKLRRKKMDIKGRGRHGIIQGDSSACRITLEEKSP